MTLSMTYTMLPSFKFIEWMTLKDSSCTSMTAFHIIQIRQDLFILNYFFTKLQKPGDMFILMEEILWFLKFYSHKYTVKLIKVKLTWKGLCISHICKFIIEEIKNFNLIMRPKTIVGMAWYWCQVKHVNEIPIYEFL